MTVSAVAKLIPKPPARVDSKNTKLSESGPRGKITILVNWMGQLDIQIFLKKWCMLGLK